MMTKVIHTVCGGIAFFFKSEVESGGIIYASNIETVDGSIPHGNDPIICGYCGQQMSVIDMRQEKLSWKDWFINEEVR